LHIWLATRSSVIEKRPLSILWRVGFPLRQTKLNPTFRFCQSEVLLKSAECVVWFAFNAIRDDGIHQLPELSLSFSFESFRLFVVLNVT